MFKIKKILGRIDKEKEKEFRIIHDLHNLILLNNGDENQKKTNISKIQKYITDLKRNTIHRINKGENSEFLKSYSKILGSFEEICSLILEGNPQAEKKEKELSEQIKILEDKYLS